MDLITFPENLSTTSGLSILIHGVISLPDMMSCDNNLILNVYRSIPLKTTVMRNVQGDLKLQSA